MCIFFVVAASRLVSVVVVFKIVVYYCVILPLASFIGVFLEFAIFLCRITCPISRAKICEQGGSHGRRGNN